MADRSAAFGVNNITAMVADPTSGYVYFSTSTGDVYKWNAETGSTVLSAHVGTNLTSIALSPEHTYLMTGEANGATDQPLRFENISASDLSSTAIQIPVGLQNPGDTFENSRLGVHSLAIIPGYKVLFNSSYYSLSGYTTTGLLYSTSDIGAHYLNFTFLSSGWMFSSENNRYIVVADEIAYPSAIYAYDSVTGILSATPFDFLNAPVYGTVSISETAGLIAYDDGRLRVIDLTGHSDHEITEYVDGGAVRVLDLPAHLVHQITDVSDGGYIASATAFLPGGHQLLAWDTTNNLLRAYDTQTWTQVGAFTMPAWGGGGPSTGPAMIVGDNGQFLYLAGNQQSIDLAAKLSLTVTGTGGNDALYGAAGADSLSGLAGDDTISGGLGDDTIDGGGGADVLDGGDGNNMVVFAHAASGVVLDLTTGANNTGATLSNFKNATGSAYDDSLVGTAGANSLFGGAGNDTLAGGQGADTLDGGAGHDLIIGGSGADRILIGLGQSDTQAGHPDVIQNWHAGDTLVFNGGITPGNYLTGSAPDYASALSAANYAIGLGRAKFIAMAVGSDVVVFADSANDGGVADDAVILQGRTLADISIADIASQPASEATPGPSHTPPPAPPEPSAPTLPLAGAHGTITGNMDAAHLADLFPATLTQASATEVTASGFFGLGFDLVGSNFQYTNNQLSGGAATHLTLTDLFHFAPALHLDLALPHTDVSSFETWLANDQTQTAFQTLLSGGDQLSGGASADLIRGYGGDDLIAGGGGADSLFGGDGNDVIYAGLPPGGSGSGPAGSTWLRGEAGDDYIVGGAGYDNVNGNQGNDTIDGGSGGGDWLLGGQGNDLIFAHAGDNIINGNLGDDSIVGGSGHDSLRGGQGNDIIWAGSGGDWISGDRGDDTLVAGQGADTFYVAPGAGHDLVLGFDPAHDHVQVAAGATWHVAQLDTDTIVDLGPGDKLILVGVQLSTLPSGWIFSG